MKKINIMASVIVISEYSAITKYTKKTTVKGNIKVKKYKLLLEIPSRFSSNKNFDNKILSGKYDGYI
jgi:hypothetical protein